MPKKSKKMPKGMKKGAVAPAPAKGANPFAAVGKAAMSQKKK